MQATENAAHGYKWGHSVHIYTLVVMLSDVEI